MDEDQPPALSTAALVGKHSAVVAGVVNGRHRQPVRERKMHVFRRVRRPTHTPSPPGLSHSQISDAGMIAKVLDNFENNKATPKAIFAAIEADPELRGLLDTRAHPKNKGAPRWQVQVRKRLVDKSKRRRFIKTGEVVEGETVWRLDTAELARGRDPRCGFAIAGARRLHALIAFDHVSLGAVYNATQRDPNLTRLTLEAQRQLDTQPAREAVAHSPRSSKHTTFFE